MSDTKHSVSNLVLLPLIVVAAIALVGYGATAMAQEQQQQPQEQQQPAAQEEQPAEEFKEEVVVTGTLIPRPTLEAMSPVSTLEIDELTYRGVTRMEDLLTQLPQVFASQNAIISNGSSGTATVNLRNLGEVRTMVLIDGRRMTAGDANQPGADLNFIPSALVKRVDILTGGASATYGADAVAGVVNFIIDREFEGIRGGVQFTGFNHSNNNDFAQSINADRGFTPPTGTAWDGNTFTANLAIGGKFAEGRGHATLYLDYRDAKQLRKDARDYTNCALETYDPKFNPSPTGTARCGGSGTSDLGTFYVYDPEDNYVGQYKVDPNGSHTWVPRAGYVFNYNPYNFLQRPDTRWVAGGFLNYDFNEAVQGYLEVMYMNDKTDAQIAPSGNFFDTYNLNVDNPMLSQQQRQILLDAGWGPHDIATVNIGRRNVEGGARADLLSHNSWRMLAGFKGDIGKGWSYDVNGLLAQVSAPETYINDVSQVAIQDALIVDGDPNDPTTWHCRSGNAGCVPWNIFRTGQVTQGALNWIDVSLLSENGTTTKIVTGKLSGDLGEYGVTIPSASEGIQVALGADYGVFGMYYRPDQAYQDGIASGQGSSNPPFNDAYDVTELFAEAFIPIVQDVRGAKDLSLELGYRYSDYSTTGAWPTYKAQASWAPGAGLKFRAGFSRATRAPNVNELFSPQAFQLGGNIDPCAGAEPTATFEQCARTGVTASQYGQIQENPAGQYNTLFTGNPLLDPEVADTISYGLVFTPSGSSFTAALDYYRIEVNDYIGTLAADDIINSCLAAGDPVICSYIHRDRFGSLWQIVGGAEGSYIDTATRNLPQIVSEGLDLNLNYVLPAGNSFFTFNLIGTYLLTSYRDSSLYAYDCVSYFGDRCNDFYGVTYGLSPEWRHLARVSWETGPLVFSLGWRYLTEMKHESYSDDPGISDPAYRQGWEDYGSGTIPAKHYFDLAFNWKLMDGLQFTLGCNNVLDEEPPLGAGLQSIGYGPGFYGAYDAYGRYLFSGIQFGF